MVFTTGVTKAEFQRMLPEDRLSYIQRILQESGFCPIYYEKYESIVIYDNRQRLVAQINTGIWKVSIYQFDIKRKLESALGNLVRYSC